MARLVFIDDDDKELDDMGDIVQGEYEYVRVRWPFTGSLDDQVGPPPSLFVTDLYFPPDGNDVSEFIPDDRVREHADKAKQIGEAFQKLYENGCPGREILRKTFDNIQKAYDLLWEQCRDLKQSSENGRALLRKIKSHPRYKNVPVVVYSRKLTVEDAVRVLQDSAISVVPKVRSPVTRTDKESVLNQLKLAQSINASWWRNRIPRLFGLNINVTLFSHEDVDRKIEITGLKLGG